MTSIGELSCWGGWEALPSGNKSDTVSITPFILAILKFELGGSIAAITRPLHLIWCLSLAESALLVAACCAACFVVKARGICASNDVEHAVDAGLIAANKPPIA